MPDIRRGRVPGEPGFRQYSESGNAIVKGVRPVVLEFALLMEQKLRANDHKTGWRGMQNSELIQRLTEEAKELSDAIDIQEGIPSEAADVANFAMFIWDKNREAGSLAEGAESRG